MANAESVSIVHFQKQFGTEEDCASYLIYKKWKDDGYECAKCNHQFYYYISTRQLYECQHCHYQSSITAGTLHWRISVTPTIQKITTNQTKMIF